jgi:6-phosphogluconolactonase (cycloisomerase 2 family)
MMKNTRLLTRTVVFLACSVTNVAQAQSPDILSKISAGRVAVISDGDYVAGTYANSILAPAGGAYRDAFTLLSIQGGKVTSSEVLVSNSVTAAPEILELTQDGRTAFVTERLGQRPESGTRVSDLPPGRRLFAIDLSDPSAPRIAATAEIEVNPEGLAVSPDGRHVAVVSNSAEKSVVQVVEFLNGRFGDVRRYDLADLGVSGTASRPRGGVTATNVQWHPNGEVLAVNVNTQDRVAFLRFADGAAEGDLEIWGNIVDVGKDPFVGRFTPDGRHYLTSNWGRNFVATTLEGRIPEASSTMSVIRIADLEADTPKHGRLATIDTGVSAEGMAVSPDGRMVATFNMQGTSFPPSSPRYGREAAVSLMTFDPDQGRLTKIGDYPFQGVLPEGGTFDLTGDHLIATVFEGHPGTGPELGAGLEVFRVVKGNAPRLERLGRVALPHGAHHVDVSR